MSQTDPLNLNGYFKINHWLNMVPKVKTFQCEICRWSAPSFRILNEHLYLLHEFPLIRPISPVPSPKNESSDTPTAIPSFNPNVMELIELQNNF